MKILVINCGSSSLKYQLFDMNSTTVMAKGLCERIGLDGVLSHSANGSPAHKQEIAMPDHKAAMKTVMAQLMEGNHAVLKNLDDISAVGHRVAHGGNYFTSSTVIDDQVLEAIRDCVPLAPLHNPAALMGIEACMSVLGQSVQQVAVFDTAFHQSIPAKAYSYAIPYEVSQRHRIRRYGFHGTSHRYVAQLASIAMAQPLNTLKIITCHLGNGSSITAIDCGKSIDTTMGFTPLEGLPMGTRSGTVDPAILPFLMKAENLSGMEIDAMLNKQSGLLGLSGISSDLREIEQAAGKGNEQAANAIEVLCYQIKKTIGAYIAAMNGVDAIVFTAGIGENSALIREKSLAGLDRLGICIDQDKNNTRADNGEISAESAPVKVFVIPTNEELVIANDTLDLVTQVPSQSIR